MRPAARPHPSQGPVCHNPSLLTHRETGGCATMGVLRALLIAVPMTGLEFVREDTQRIKKALLQSGYAESDVTVRDTLDTTRREHIYAALHTFFDECQDDDFALVHFSGHGVRIGEREFLVPAYGDPAAEEEGLVEVVPDVFFKRLRSQATVMMCLDACRDEPDDEFKSLATFPAPSRSRENVFVVRACAPGQRALGTEAGSFMSRALAEALDHESPQKTVEDVITYVRRRTRELAQLHDGTRRHQVEDLWLGGDMARAPARHKKLEICGSGAGTQEWVKAVHDSNLWDRVTGHGVDKGRLRSDLSRLIDKVLAIRQDAALPNKAGPDPWDDVEFPQRVIKRLESLIPAAPEGKLSPLEAVALLATPFVREAAVACGRRALAELYPPQGPQEDRRIGDAPSPNREDSSNRDDGRQLLREDMADVRKAYKQVDAKRRRLLDAQSDSAAAAVESWLRHRLLADWDQLWAAADGSEPLIGALDSLRTVMAPLLEAAEFAVYLGPRPYPRSHDELRSALLQVISQMRTPPAASAPNGKTWQKDLATQLGLAPRRKWWRPRELAGLLHVAELLAIDPRSLDGIVVDHLGERYLEVRPVDLVEQVRGSEFHPVGYASSRAPGTTTPDQRVDWTLRSPCDSAALHVALERQADAATTAARNLCKDLPNEELLDALPKHLNTDALPAVGNRSYEAPPPRFQLAEDGVKPLIMGTQLYGDRMLAVRELYQNALDACRRRWARQKYAQATVPSNFSGPRLKELAEYTIEFTLGRDPEDQRTYIECADHGIGMTEEELRDLFARAGRRYEQSPTRVRELRRWRRARIDPELNSRFGIGVFSYFMLAEQITVITRPASETGRTAEGPGYRVDVVADSGLMHITKAERADAGTTVRLYLRPEDCTHPPSLVQFLREQIWHSPVTLLVEECLDSPRPDRRDPNVLKAANVTLAVPQEKSPDGPWWVRGRGARLVDGIFVGEDERPHGYVINLRRKHGADLSANRNQLQRFDEALVYQELAAAVDALTHWDPMPLSWLWDLVRDDPHLGEMVVEQLLTTDVTVSVHEWHGRRMSPPVRLPLAVIGCLPFDKEGRLNSSPQIRQNTGYPYFRWWRSQLVSDGSRRGGGARWAVGRPPGFPEPVALDALLFSDSGLSDPLAVALRASLISGHSLRTTLRALRRHAVAGVSVPPVSDLRCLDGMEIDPLLRGLYEAYVDLGESRLSRGDLAPPVHLAIPFAAAEEDRTLGEIAELVRQLHLLDPSVPEPPELGELARHIPEEHELSILEAEYISSLEGLPAVVTPPVAAYLSAHLDVPVADVLNTARRYEPLGFRVTGDLREVHEVDAVHPGLSEPLGLPRLLNKPFDLLRLARYSAERDDADIGTTAAFLREAVMQLGMGEVSPGPLAAIKAPAWWANLPLSVEEAHRPLSTWTVLCALAETPPREPTEDVVRSVEALAAAGLVDTAAPAAVGTWMDTPQPLRPRLLTEDRRHVRFRDRARTFSVRPPATSNRVDTLFLLVLAADHRLSIGQTADMVRAQAEPYGIEVDEIPLETRDLEPDLTVIDILTTGQGSGWKAEITHPDIIAYASAYDLNLTEAMRRLREYEPLGAAPAPSAAPVPSRQCRGAEEQAATVERLFSFEPLSRGTVTPLALTVTAVRLNLGLRSTFRTLVPYTAYGVIVECPEPTDDDHDPDWRDVILLTQRLTGREPALSGEVSDEHIQLAAEETGLHVGEVRDRLTYYAPLFGFDLPTRDADVPQMRSNTHAES
ncbi:caspase family protein [Streptomyces sp. NPDC049627]|uniref:HD domain-containing protein n=1 Tax=Streptomyces sp. NPDC049627 TaxID=3365595 RepID=UPI0037AA3771